MFKVKCPGGHHFSGGVCDEKKMTPHINLFDISGSGEPGFPYLVTTRLSRDIAIFVKRREIVVEINHERVKSFLSSLFVLLRFGTDKHQVYRRNRMHSCTCTR